MHCQRIRKYGMLSSKWDLHTAQPSPQGSALTSKKRGGVGIGNRGKGSPQQNTLWRTWRGYCTQRLTAGVTAETRPVPCEGGQNCFVDWGEAHEVLPLAKEPLAVDGCWKRMSQFSTGVWSPRGYTCSSRHPTPMKTQAVLRGFSEFCKRSSWRWEVENEIP